LFAYRYPKNFPAATAGPDVEAAWQAFLDSLGTNLADAGNPAFQQSTVGNTGADTVLGGYSILTADNLQAASKLAEGAPFVKLGGGVEVGELTLLNPANISTTADDHARATQQPR
jgi:hypothetical protein